MSESKLEISITPLVHKMALTFKRLFKCLSNGTNSKAVQPNGKILGSRKSKMAASNLEIPKF